MSTKVFVSSTCYDLIDVRSEIENVLKENGLTPILSDSSTSDFNINLDINSIECCLVNVKVADVFIIILSQRYGGSLLSSGYGDISATHLEYLTAAQNNLPIYMYVRDRLEAEYSIYKKNKENPGTPLNLSWIKPNDVKIFDILESHRKLSKDNNKSNWIGTFKNSLELKELLIRDLQLNIGKAIVKRLIDQRKIPFFIIKFSQSIEPVSQSIEPHKRKVNLHFSIKNPSEIILLNPKIRLIKNGVETIKGMNLKLTTFDANFLTSRDMEIIEEESHQNLSLNIRFTLPEGVTIEAEHKIEYSEGLVYFMRLIFVSNNNLQIDVLKN